MHELIAPTINFVLVIILLVYFVKKPLKQLLQSRHQTIKSEVEEARAQRIAAEQRYQEFQSKLSKFESEATTLLHNAKAESEALRARIIREAQNTAERILREAEATAQANIQEYKNQLSREIISKAVETAEQILKQRLTQEDQHRLVQDYLKGVQNS